MTSFYALEETRTEIFLRALCHDCYYLWSIQGLPTITTTSSYYAKELYFFEPLVWSTRPVYSKRQPTRLHIHVVKYFSPGGYILVSQSRSILPMNNMPGDFRNAAKFFHLCTVLKFTLLVNRSKETLRRNVAIRTCSKMHGHMGT